MPNQDGRGPNASVRGFGGRFQGQGQGRKFLGRFRSFQKRSGCALWNETSGPEKLEILKETKNNLQGRMNQVDKMISELQ